MRLLKILILLCLAANTFYSQSDSEVMRKGPNFKLEDLDGNLIELNT